MSTKTTKTASVAPLTRRPRKGLLRLIKVMEKVGRDDLFQLVGYAGGLSARYPRFQVPISVDVSAMSDTAVEVIGLAERIADQALLDLERLASRLAAEYAVHQSAEVIKFPRGKGGAA